MYCLIPVASSIWTKLETSGVRRLGKVCLIKKKKNTFAISAGAEKQNITVLCTYSADSTAHPSTIVYPYKKSIPKEVGLSVPDEYIISKSSNGWMKTGTFYEYIVNGLYPSLVKKVSTFQ